MAFGSPAVDFDFFLNRKYQLLQQQADAGSTNAASGAIQANAQAGALGAEAGLNRVRAQLAPDESLAQTTLQRSQANLNDQSAQIIVPEATARIGQIGAETSLIGTQNRVLRKNNFTGVLGGDAGTLPGGTPYSGFRLPAVGPAIDSTPTPTAQKPGESYAAWTARLRALRY